MTLQITLESGRLGPFGTVFTDPDAYRVTGLDGAPGVLPKTVVGVGVVEPWVGELPAPPPPPPPPVPQAITMRQARLVLLGAGKLSLVAPAIAAIPDPATRAAAEIEWEFSNELQRHNTFVQMLAPGLGLSSAQVDALFIAGAAL